MMVGPTVFVELRSGRQLTVPQCDQEEPPERKFEASMDKADRQRKSVNLRERHSVRNLALGMNKGLEITRSYLHDVVHCGCCKGALCRTNDLVHDHDDKAVDIALDDSPDNVICVPSGRAHLCELGEPFLLHAPGHLRSEANWSYLVRNVGCGACGLFLGIEVIRTVAPDELSEAAGGFPLLRSEGEELVWLLKTSHRPLISAPKTCWVDARNKQHRKSSLPEQFPSHVPTATTACPSDCLDFTCFASSFIPFLSSRSSVSLDVLPHDTSSVTSVDTSSTRVILSSVPSARDASGFTPRAGVEEAGSATMRHGARGGWRDSLLKFVLALLQCPARFSFREKARRSVELLSGQQPPASSRGTHGFGTPPMPELVGKWWWQKLWMRLTVQCPSLRRQELRDQRQPLMTSDVVKQNSIPISQVYLGFRFLELRSTMDKPTQGGAAIYCGSPSCNTMFSDTNQILDVTRRWGIGQGRPERAMFMNSLVTKNIDVRNPRWHRLAQGCFDMADVFCAKCQRQVGYAFVADKSEEKRNVNQVGRYGLVCSAVRLCLSGMPESHEHARCSCADGCNLVQPLLLGELPSN